MTPHTSPRSPPVPDTFAIYLSLLFIVWRPGLPANSELDWPAAARDSRPSQAQSSPRLPSPQPPRSQAGPELWPGWTLVMEPQGLSPLLSAHVYSLAHVCLMILFRVTPQSGWGLRAILLRPLSLPRPRAPGLLIHHFTEQQQREGSVVSRVGREPVLSLLRAEWACPRTCILMCIHTSMCLFMCACVWVVVPLMCVHVQTCLCVCTHVGRVCIHVHACVSVYKCMYPLCPCVCVYVCAFGGLKRQARAHTRTHQSLSVFAWSLLERRNLES